jgi:Tol biopolymer transport system component
VPFDADALKITGAPIPVADEVRGWDGVGLAFADVASDGTLVYVPRNPLAEQRELVWIDRKGAATPISARRRDYQQAKLSPDGAQLAAVVEEHGRRDLWLYEFRRDLWRRLTTGETVITAVWSPDSSQIFFSSGRSGGQDIYSMPIDGSAPARDVTRDKANWQMPVSVSPDNRYVLVIRQQRESLHILLLDVQHPDRMEILVSSASDAAFSPDGKWFAFVADEAGHDEVYLARFPDASRKWLVSSGGGNTPIWRRDGRELYYANGKKLMAVDMSQPSIGKARVLFENELEVTDIASDGQRFIGFRSEKVPPTTQLNVITGLFDNLQALQRRPGGN